MNDEHTIGLKADGTVVAVGWKEHGRCDVSGWKLFNNLDTMDEEREEAKAKKKAALEQERAALQSEYANLKGLFSGIRRGIIEARMAEIENMLQSLE